MKIKFVCETITKNSDNETSRLLQVNSSPNKEEKIDTITIFPFRKLEIRMKDKKDYGFFVPGEMYVMEFSKLAKEPNLDEITPEEAARRILPNF